jgi:betaine lipid synthase
MASPGGNILPPDINAELLLAGIAGVVFFAIGFSKLFAAAKRTEDPGLVKSFLLFCYSCFIKRHADDENGTQQSHLESFYSNQASVYDVTRKTLLKGREDMLALVAAQLAFKTEKGGAGKKKRVWVDVSIPPGYIPYP